MKTLLFKKHKSIEHVTVWVNVLFMVLVIGFVVAGTMQYDQKTKGIETETLENTIEKYVITCFATEGSYPPNLAYLEAHYGLQLDETRYYYDYEVFASNVMPSIKVIKKSISRE